MPRTNPYYRGPVSDHFDGVRFFGPGEGIETDKSRADLLRLMFRTPFAPWPAHIEHPTSVPPARVEGSALRVTTIGHASHLIQTRGLNILIDPVWSERASPFRFAGPRRVSPPGVKLADLPKLDAILITHNHYDHLDLSTLATLAGSHRCRIIVPVGNDAILRRYAANLTAEAYDWGDATALAPGIEVHLVPCHHWSARSLGDRRMALWSAFVIATPDGPIYHIGDTAWRDGRIFSDIPKRFGAPRLAVIPIGAYAPRWFMRSQHVEPAESVRIFQACETHYALAHHWGTFRLTAEPIDEPPQRLAAALDAAGVPAHRFRVQSPGEAFDVPGRDDPPCASSTSRADGTPATW